MKRIAEIDYLRGLAILAMIMIHTNAYYLSNSLAAFVWDGLEWAVPIFILCSSYIFFQREQYHMDHTFFMYLKKRVSRLVIPYYIFALLFILIFWIREPTKISLTYIVHALTLTGGIDINWLVLLFIQFTFVLPFLGWSYASKKMLFWIYTSIAFLVAIMFLFFTFPYNYLWIMWLPWSLICIYTLFLVRYHTKKWFYVCSIIGGGLLYGITLLLQKYLGHEIVLYDNKYPPNIYFIAYGVMWLGLLHLLTKTHIFSLFPLKPILTFLSTFSYEIYFVHYIILYLIGFLVWDWKLNWIEFFLVVTSLTCVTQYILVGLRKNFKKR